MERINKPCIVCSEIIYDATSWQKYCANCAKIRKKENDKERWKLKKLEPKEKVCKKSPKYDRFMVENKKIRERKKRIAAGTMGEFRYISNICKRMGITYGAFQQISECEQKKMIEEEKMLCKI